MTDDIRLDLSDPTLFGNDAAEDEEEDIFEAYFVSRPEEDEFVSEVHKIRILRAYKGEGKSALLRRARKRLEDSGCIVARTTGSGIVPDISSEDPDQWTRGWKVKILSLIANEIGSRIGWAYTDDAIALVEEAEKNGFKARSFFSSVADRVQSSKIPVKHERIGVASPEKVLSRYMDGKKSIWLIVDDIDENFRNTTAAKAKVAAFFSACRQIVNLIPEIRIRSGIRPNVWTILKSDAESLSKVEQYIVDIQWNDDHIRTILAKRIEGFLTRTNPDALHAFMNHVGSYREERLIGVAFQEKMSWGYDSEKKREKFRPPQTILATLSSRRPRWMIEIGKAASKNAVNAGSQKITLDHIVANLEAFGRNRIANLSAEYSSYCPQINEVIQAFADQQEDYTTGDLHKLIKNKILGHITVAIAGNNGPNTATQVAHMLYQIGFLTAREDLGEGGYKHYAFAEQPDLLNTRTNLDRGFTWEIHPVFRQALGLRKPSGEKNIAGRSNAKKKRGRR